MGSTLTIGDHVVKVTGYRWPGVIVSKFSTTTGKTRFVVECTVPEVAGALHIFAPEQIRIASGGQRQPRAKIACEELRRFVECIERLKAEKRAITTRIKDASNDVRAAGFDVETVLQIVRLRRLDPDERQEQAALLHLYMGALGMAPAAED